jgi:hypothetical protein
MKDNVFITKGALTLLESHENLDTMVTGMI